MKEQGRTQKEIALALNKDKSSVSRELKRNSDTKDGLYKPELANEKYLTRLKNKPKNIKFTDEVKDFVVLKLNDEYSPEQIAGRAKLDKITCVSHERIYQFIWSDKKNGGMLYKKLRRNGRKYRKRGNLKDKRGIIKDRIGIEYRPKIVDDKTRFGDLEIDTMIGKNHKGAIITINDRVTSLVWMRKLAGKEAKALASITINTLTPLKDLLYTITADNGKEFALHKTIKQDLGVDFFFARPYHSWERGANENINGLIRQYFPKGSSFDNISELDIKRVQNKLNNRPRKKLGFLSPIEFFSVNFANLNINNNVAFVT